MSSPLPGLAFGLAVLFASAAAADEEEALLSTFVEAQDGARSCWGQTYDQAWLTEHKDQQVTAMQLNMQFEAEPPSDMHPEGRPMFNYSLDVKTRDYPEGLQAMGNCLWGQDGGIFCGVECDGGGVDVSHADDGQVLVDLESSGFIRMLVCGAQGERVSLKSGPDDKQYLLSPLPSEQCPAVVLPDYEAGVD